MSNPFGILALQASQRQSSQIKSLHPEIRILYMFWLTVNAIVHQGVLDKGLTLLNKPFTRAVLAQKVREALDAELPVQ